MTLVVVAGAVLFVVAGVVVAVVQAAWAVVQAIEEASELL